MTKAPKRAALYLRVSTDAQTTENQRLELETVAAGRGWTIEATYEDAGISGAKGRDERPGLDRMLKDASRGKFDVLMAWDVSRLGRSLQDLVALMQDLRAAGRAMYLHQQNLDTTTPSGRAMFQMCGVFAEFEREMIRERVNAGLARARSQGKRIGRPTVSQATEARIRELAAWGMGKVKIAKAAGCGVSAVQRVLKAATAWDPARA
jgi:DNA invertase Pin-like site-specific DNA recombinase